MEESYKLPLEQLDDLIAECSFENHPYCDWEYEIKNRNTGKSRRNYSEVY